MRTDWRILSIPFGPRVVLTRSATAIAPTKEDMRACSPYVDISDRKGERLSDDK